MISVGCQSSRLWMGAWWSYISIAGDHHQYFPVESLGFLLICCIGMLSISLSAVGTMVTSNFFSPIITWWQYLHRNPTYRSHILTSFHFGGSKVFWAKNRHSECDCATGLDPFHIKLYIAKTPTSRRVLLFTDQPRNGTGTTTTCGHLHQLHTSTQTFPIGWPPDFPECSSQPAVSRLSTRPGKVKQPWGQNKQNQSINQMSQTRFVTAKQLLMIYQ